MDWNRFRDALLGQRTCRPEKITEEDNSCCEQRDNEVSLIDLEYNSHEAIINTAPMESPAPIEKQNETETKVKTVTVKKTKPATKTTSKRTSKKAAK